MGSGIALAAGEVPVRLVKRFDLEARLHSRGAEGEFRFLSRDDPRELPVVHGGRLRVVRWGCRRGESKVLPCTGWTWRESVEGGQWSGWGAEEVLIPATLGLANGVWYRIRQGVRGLLVRDERGREAVYVVCEPASRYFQVMCRSDRMPVLVGERI